MPSVPQLFKWSPRPGDHTQTPNPSGAPNAFDTPASQSSSRFNPFGTLQTNVRSMINGSSIYSQSPNPNPASNSTFTTPKIPFLERFRRDQPPAPIAVPSPNDPQQGSSDSWDSSDSRSPLRPPHTAGSYMRTIAPLEDSREAEGRVVYSQGGQAGSELNRHPADVPLDYGGSGAGDHVVEARETHEEINERRRQRRRRRRRHHTRNRNDAWVRRRSERGNCFQSMKATAARGKLMACIISGLFLVTVLAIYLALALSRNDLGQEVHVLFIMIVLGTTIFFCHSLIRLCMLLLHPPPFDGTQPLSIPSMTGPEGFQPVRPIQVHLARDEDLEDGYDEERELEGGNGTNDREGEEIREKPVLLPPPAYGLWRSSVRVDPNLLHWQRVDNAQSVPSGPRTISAMSTNSFPRSGLTSRNGSVSSVGSAPNAAMPPIEEPTRGPRPPSYVSEDGVSYIVEAAPRSVAPSHTGVSDIHPAWRPGYAISEVAMDEWPRSQARR